MADPTIRAFSRFGRNSFLRGTALPALAVGSLLLASCQEPLNTAADPAGDDVSRGELALGLALNPGSYSLQAVHSGKCVEVAGLSTADGANIHQWTCHTMGNQKFKLIPTATTPPDTTKPIPPNPTWRPANLTWYTSYPDPGSEECIAYNGCTWAGYFAALDGKQPESWVKATNIAAVHEKDFSKYRLKTLRLKQGTRQIDVKVYDMCSDSDCDGCCTRNAGAAGFLIDIESHTADRFGARSGTVDWTCLDCTP